MLYEKTHISLVLSFVLMLTNVFQMVSTIKLESNNASSISTLTHSNGNDNIQSINNAICMIITSIANRRGNEEVGRSQNIYVNIVVTSIFISISILNARSKETHK